MWNLMLGYAGLISVGQQGFIGIGAYTLWLFSDIIGINPLISVVFAAIGGCIIALPAAALVFKLRGGYLAIGTWVIAEILRLIVSNIKRTGGGSGITIQATSKMAQRLGAEGWMPRVYWWALAAAVIAMVVTYLLLRSRTGLALKAMRDNDLAAESSGVNLWRTKLYTYVIAGARLRVWSARSRPCTRCACIPGSAFAVSWTAYLIFITVIGGIGTIEGPIIGTVIFYVLRETTSKYGTWYFIVLGILAIIVTIWSPAGIYGWILEAYRLQPLPAPAEDTIHRPTGFARSRAEQRGGCLGEENERRSQCAFCGSGRFHPRAVHDGTARARPH